jgi:hypothetical protein
MSEENEYPGPLSEAIGTLAQNGVRAVYQEESRINALVREV